MDRRERREVLLPNEPVKSVEIGGVCVNLVFPNPIKPIDLGIPACRYFSEFSPDTHLSVEYQEADTASITWNALEGKAVITGPLESLADGSQLIFVAIGVSEFERQRNGRFLTHGAAIASLDNRGVLLLGNKGAGKTSMILALGARGYSLIGNDQVLFGKSQGGIDIYEGTKYITLRKYIQRYDLPGVKNINFVQRGQSDFDTKVKVTPEEMGLSVCNHSVPLAATVLIHLDGTGTERSGIRRLGRNDIQTNLFLAEKLSRHISGIATPLHSMRGELIGLSPSFDDALTLRNRLEVIASLYERGVYQVWGGNIEEISDLIDQVVTE